MESEVQVSSSTRRATKSMSSSLKAEGGRMGSCSAMKKFIWLPPTLKRAVKSRGKLDSMARKHATCGGSIIVPVSQIGRLLPTPQIGNGVPITVLVEIAEVTSFQPI